MPFTIIVESTTSKSNPSRDYLLQSLISTFQGGGCKMYPTQIIDACSYAYSIIYDGALDFVYYGL